MPTTPAMEPRVSPSSCTAAPWGTKERLCARYYTSNHAEYSEFQQQIHLCPLSHFPQPQKRESNCLAGLTDDLFICHRPSCRFTARLPLSAVPWRGWARKGNF